MNLSSNLRTRWILTQLLWPFLLGPSSAEIQVNFSHSYNGATNSVQNTGNITLQFTVSNVGNVTLDASCVNTGAQAYVNEFDGNVGTVANAALWGETFTITLSSDLTNSGNLRIDNLGRGLGIQGQNPHKIDDTSEILNASITGTSLQSNLLTISFTGADSTGQKKLDLNTTSYDLTTQSGTIDVSNQNVGMNFSVSSQSDLPNQGFTLSGISFDFPISSGATSFDNESGDQNWNTSSNWSNNSLPAANDNAIIDGFDVLVNTPVAIAPAELEVRSGSISFSDSASINIKSMIIGRQLTSDVTFSLGGSGASINADGTAEGHFAFGTSSTIISIPDGAGSRRLQLGPGTLELDLGSEWILDGSGYSGPYDIGTTFQLATFENFVGSTSGFRTRNFDLPANRALQLVVTATSIHYEIISKNAATGPNVIVINVDDIVGGQHYAFEGRDCLTPTIDSLVAEGLNFTNAFAASTVCGPSRYSLLTGRLPSRNTSATFLAKYPLQTLGRFGVSDTQLENDKQNIGAWMQQAGYRTGFVGKGHVWDDAVKSTSNWENIGLITYGKTDDPANNPTVNGAMKHNHRVLCQRMRAVGFDYVSSFYSANLLELRNDSLNVHNQEWITKGALEFIDENHHEKFFLYMAPTINHGPVRNDLSKTLGADHRYTGAGYFPDIDFSFMPSRQTIRNEVTAAGKSLISARETWLDYSIEAILNKLTSHGIRNDTLIIFTSDHGEKTLNSPIIWGKSSLYDGGMKVPFIMNWPAGITSPGRTYPDLVSHLDIVPTLLELTNASELPTRPSDGVGCDFK